MWDLCFVLQRWDRRAGTDSWWAGGSFLVRMRTTQRSPWIQGNRWDAATSTFYIRKYFFYHVKLPLWTFSPPSRMWWICSTHFSAAGQRGNPTWRRWAKSCVTLRHSSRLPGMRWVYRSYCLLIPPLSDRCVDTVSAPCVCSRQENSMHLLVGLLTGSSAACRLQAARCLHQLSHSPHSSVSPACLPSTPYLLTYLSGQSIRFTVSAWRVPAPCRRQISLFALNFEIFSFFHSCNLFCMCACTGTVSLYPGQFMHRWCCQRKTPGAGNHSSFGQLHWGTKRNYSTSQRFGHIHLIS